jgi:hypothetical protein
MLLGLVAPPHRAVAIGWPKCNGSASHVAKMLNQFDRMKLDVIHSERACVPRHPWIAPSAPPAEKHAFNGFGHPSECFRIVRAAWPSAAVVRDMPIKREIRVKTLLRNSSFFTDTASVGAYSIHQPRYRKGVGSDRPIAAPVRWAGLCARSVAVVAAHIGVAPDASSKIA